MNIFHPNSDSEFDNQDNVKQLDIERHFASDDSLQGTYSNNEILNRLIEEKFNESQKRIFRLKFSKNKSFEEIAKILVTDIETVKAYFRKTLLKLRSVIEDYNKRNHILIIPLSNQITTKILSNDLLPYIESIEILQNFIDTINGETSEVLIKSISQNSPVSISLDGAADAVQILKDTIIPWRRNHLETMARLIEQEKLIEIEVKRAEILEKRARAEKDRIEASKQREETTKLKLENEKLSFEIHEAKIKLVINILSRVSPGLSENEKANLMLKLLKPIENLISKDVEIKPPI